MCFQYLSLFFISPSINLHFFSRQFYFDIISICLTLLYVIKRLAKKYVTGLEMQIFLKVNFFFEISFGNFMFRQESFIEKKILFFLSFYLVALCKYEVHILQYENCTIQKLCKVRHYINHFFQKRTDLQSKFDTNFLPKNLKRFVAAFS